MNKANEIILAVETSSALSSAALLQDGAITAIHRWREERRGNRLVQEIALLLESAGLTAAQLTAAAVGLGPGNYSGLRVSYTAVRALALPYGIPVHGYPSAMIMAAQHFSEKPGNGLLTVFGDARRNRLWSVGMRCADGRIETARELQLCPLNEISGGRPDGTAALTSDWDQLDEPSRALLQNRLPGLTAAAVYPDAETLAGITARDRAANCAPPPGLPVYVHPAVFVPPRFTQGTTT